jgi:putative transposase
MPQSLSQILLHIIFSTKNREPLILPEVEKDLFAYIASICNELDCFAPIIDGVKDHVHIACNLSRTIAVCDLLEEVKKSSSKWIKTKGSFYKNFTWQRGYGAFSLGMSQLPALKKYVLNQKEHHCKKTFQEEYLELLKKYKVEYDERYVWD